MSYQGKKKSRILLIIPNLGRGGAQQVFRDQFDFLSQRFDVYGCVFNWEGAFPQDRNDRMISLDVPAGKSWLAKIQFFLSRIQKLKAIKKQYGIDFSISHLEGADYVNLFSKQKEKVICWIHGTKAFDRNIEGLLGVVRKKLLIPYVYKRADHVVTVSKGIEKELTDIFYLPHQKVRTIVNGFDVEEIARKSNDALPDELLNKLFESRTILVTHCRLARQKNLFALLDIYRLLADDSAKGLLILGDGELRESLVDYSRSLGLKTYTVWGREKLDNTCQVYFLGYQANPYPFLRRSQLYLMTSSWEGFPLSLCEAMACGVPVLSSDCYTGPREIIIEDNISLDQIAHPFVSRNGILMPLADSNVAIGIWADTIMKVLKQDALRGTLSMNGRERIGAFDKKEIAQQWLNVFAIENVLQ